MSNIITDLLTSFNTLGSTPCCNNFSTVSLSLFFAAICNRVLPLYITNTDNYTVL